MSTWQFVRPGCSSVSAAWLLVVGVSLLAGVVVVDSKAAKGGGAMMCVATSGPNLNCEGSDSCYRVYTNDKKKKLLNAGCGTQKVHCQQVTAAKGKQKCKKELSQHDLPPGTKDGKKAGTKYQLCCTHGSNTGGKSGDKTKGGGKKTKTASAVVAHSPLVFMSAALLAAVGAVAAV